MPPNSGAQNQTRLLGRVVIATQSDGQPVRVRWIREGVIVAGSTHDSGATPRRRAPLGRDPVAAGAHEHAALDVLDDLLDERPAARARVLGAVAAAATKAGV